MSKIIRIALLAVSLTMVSVALSAQTASVPATNDTELVKLADYFSKYYQYADEVRMTEALADDFRYFTNVPCPYKDCVVGAGKSSYIGGVIGERGARGFTVESISMKYISPVNGAITDAAEPKVSFYCILETEARGMNYKTYSVIDYYFRKFGGTWKITKIENRIINR
jgi:hypothetical protein